MDKLKQLYESYISQGIITSAVSFEKFSSSSKDARSKLYKAGVDKNLFKKTTEEQFNSAWQVDEPKPAKTEAVATDPAPVTAVQKADTDSQLEDGSLDSQESDLENTRFQLDPLVIKATKSDKFKNTEANAKKLNDRITSITPASEKGEIGFEYLGFEDKGGYIAPKLEDKDRPSEYVKTNADGQEQIFKDGLPGAFDGYTKRYKNTFEEDLKIKLGGSRYNQVMKAVDGATSKGVNLTKDNLGEFIDLSSIPEHVQENIVDSLQAEASDGFIQTLDPQERLDITSMLGTDSFKNAVRKENEDRLKDEEDYFQQYGKNLVSQKTVMDLKTRKTRTFTPVKNANLVSSVDSNIAKFKKIAEKSFVNEQKEIEVFGNQLKTDLKEYETQSSKYSNSLKKLNSSYKDAKKTLENEYSEENVARVNSVVTKYNNIVNSDGFKGNEKSFKSIAEERLRLTNKVNKLTKDAGKLKLLGVQTKSLSKDYSTANRLALQLEDFFIASPLVAAADIASYIGDAASIAPIGSLGGEVKSMIDSGGRAAISYKEAVSKKVENLPQTATPGDKDFEIGNYLVSTMADQSGSFLVTAGTMLATGGTSSFLAAARAAAVSKSVFFATEYGGSIYDAKTSRSMAIESIVSLKAQLSKTVDEGERNYIKDQIQSLEGVATASDYAQTFNAFNAGTIAALAETYGTLGTVKYTKSFAKSIGPDSFKKIFNPAMSRYASTAVKTVITGGTSVVGNNMEEYLTLLGQNYSKIQTLGDDITISEGVDAEFFRTNTIVGFAASGPSLSQNITTAIQAEFSSSSDTKKRKKAVRELLIIQERLDSIKSNEDDASPKTPEAYRLEKEKNEKIKEISLLNSDVLLDASQMSVDDLDTLVDDNRQLRSILKEAQELGSELDPSDTFTKNRIEKLKERYLEILSSRDALLSKPAKAIKEQFKNSVNPAEAYYNAGLFNRGISVVKNIKGINTTEFYGENGRKKLEDFLIKKKIKNVQEYLDGYDAGANAANISGTKEILIFNDNVNYALGTLSGTKAKIAAVSPFHEVGHIQSVEAGIVKDGKIVGDGEAMVEGILADVAQRKENGEISEKDYKIFEDRIKDYSTPENGVNVDELLQLVGDLTNAGVLRKSSFGKIYEIKAFLNSFYSSVNGDATKFFNLDKASDIYDFVASWTDKLKKGKLKVRTEDEIDYSKAEINNSLKASFSKATDIESQIEALEDKYDDGLLDYDDYEQQLDNLESKLEKAKSAPVEEKVVSKPKTKEVKENTEEVIKKASDKVFKGDEVSDRNKGISKINEDIANEMLELGANSISDIKDPAKRKAIVDKLGKNNLGAVTNLTKKAAAVGKDLAIDSNLKVGYDEFFSGFSEELSALIQTYKVKVDGKKVPFGAYMNKNLSLRYGQILDKALKGRVQNAQSLDVESGSVGSVKEIAAEGSRDFDAYTSADKGLPAGELIDVTNFKNVKDRVEAVRDVINLEGVDVADLTYKKVVDDYAGVTGAEVIGLHNKNAEPEKGQDKNDFQKLAERIDGTRTLNYGKGVNGEAEVRAMQKLFIDYNDMVKFIKTIPEFNVAPFETTIDKQGRSIDLTADAKGYSVGTSNVLLKELYDIYIDPKSKSADKATKTRSITSPSGRGKGKTSQVAKVYRLKDKLRGRIDRKTVKELQKTIGITEAGEAFIPMKGVNRTKFGTALQGLTKIYAANVANTVIRKDIVDKGITSDKKPTEKVLADIGGGKSSVMFSKAVENFDPTFNVNFSKSFNKMINDEFGFKTKYYSLDVGSKDWPKQRKRFLNDYEKFVKSTAIGAFKPRFFISSKNTVNASTKKTDPFYEPFYKERRDVRNEIRNINQEYKLSNIGFVTPPSANGRDAKSIENNIKNGSILKNNQKYSSLFDKTWVSIAELIRNDKSMIPFIGHFLETSGETDHWVRLGAEFIAYDTKPKSVDFNYVDKNGKKATVKVNYEYEHAVPVNIAVKELFRAAADKNVDFLQELKRVKENYKLIALSAQDNKKLIKAGYASKMPENWNVFWDRYFNSKVSKIDGGIDIDNIMLIETIDGKQTTTPVSEVIGTDNAGSNVSFSKGLSNTFNEIIENKTGIKADDTISQVKAKMLANSKRKFNIFVPPSAEDFVGLLYATLGKGKIGDRQMKFYDRTLLKPYARAMQAVTKDRLDLGRSFKKIKKEFKTTPKDLKKKIPGSLFNKEQAVRIYIWDSIGQEVPGLSVEEVNELANYVADNENLKEFAEQVIRLNPGSKYLSPKEGWETGNITTDLLETLNESRRAKHLERWQQNADKIFSNENLNKLEAAYGTSYRRSVENILTRMKTGRNRTYGTDSQTAAWIEWINGSVGAIMFFNTRSAVLQTLSATNFINFGDNNIFAAGKAFANQKQYWSDFAKLMSSDYLLERRDSLKINVNEADIAEAAKQNGVRGAINYLLKLGFTPTKFADSFAIASGGSTFYRNRLNALIKKGMDPVAAEKAAMRDFIEISEESQQSSRPDKISQEQAGPLGRIILAFANTPAQYTRKIKKAALDLKNGRGDAKVNISRIIYYGFAQNLIFTTLQQGLFALAFGDEEENEKLFDDKKLDAVNSMLDTFIRGSGVTGSVVSVLKNVGLRIYKESEKERPKYENTANELLKISPPISSKFNKITAAGKTFSWDMDDIKEKGFDVTNPAIGAGAKVVSAFTNLPLDRVVRKVENLTAASNAELETYKRIALTLGWSKWELGIKDPKKKKKKSSGIKGYKIKNYKIKF